MAALNDDGDHGSVGPEFRAALIASQKRAIESVATSAGSIESAAAAISARLGAGGRLIYLGAGSSALIALQDGAELPGTFGLPVERIVFMIAGGMANIAHINSAAEDDIAGASSDIEGLGPLERDIVIAVSASGATPYTLARGKVARERGAILVAVVNRAASPLLHIADHPILLDSGSEALHGSTRLAAGAAQKCALGVLSTLANAQLGHVYRGHMVNVRPENDKLRRRAVHIIADIVGVDEEAAAASLARANGDVKCAIVIAAGAETRDSAQNLIDAAHGHVGDALTRLHPGAATF